MSRRRGKSLSPSLFPFLAVLVCTLGTLILLLALVAQNATDVAQQQAQAEAAAKVKSQQSQQAGPVRLTAATVEAMLREERFRAEQLVAFRDEQTADLETRRDELTYLENQMAKLQKRLREISEEVEQTLSQETDATETRQALAAIEAQIEQEQAKIEQLEKTSRGDQPRVVIVPHKGPNGTNRRPIYLECTAEGVTVWPEGSKISLTQLEQSTRSANPLDAALRAVRLHALQHYGDPIAPYPLLVVRPDGIDTYGAARRAMRDWDDQFGYELVPADLPLAYHAADPALKDRIDVAINQAAALQRVRQQQLLGNGRGYFAGRGRPRSSANERLPVLSAASLDRDGRRSGFGNLREPIGAGRRSLQPPPPPATPLIENTGSNRSSMSARAGGYTGSGYSSPSYQSPPNHASINRQWEAEMEAAARELRQTNGRGGIGRTGQGQDLPLADPLQALGSADESSQSSGRFSSSGSPPSPGDGSLTEGDQAPGSEASSGDYDSQNLANAEQVASVDAATSAEQQSNGDRQMSNRSHAGADSRRGQQSSGGPSAGGTQPPANGSPSGSQMASSASTRSEQSPSQSISNQQGPPVTRQGRDWALPDSLRSQRGGNSIIRTIRAECHEDRFVLVGTSDTATEMFGLSNGDVDQATLRLATAIRDRIKRWGPALPGGYWQPRLEVLVSAGGRARFYQLHRLMQNSGIEVIGRPMQ